MNELLENLLMEEWANQSLPRSKERPLTDTGKALGLDGPGVYQLIASDGKVWTFDAPTQADKAEYELWCKQQVLAGIRDLQSAMQPLEYREMLSTITADCGAGLYRWGAAPGIGMARLMGTEEGSLKLMELLLRHRQPWLTQEDLAQLALTEPVRVTEAIRECLTVPPSKSSAGIPSQPTPAVVGSP